MTYHVLNVFPGTARRICQFSRWSAV